MGILIVTDGSAQADAGFTWGPTFYGGRLADEPPLLLVVLRRESLRARC